MVLSMNKENAIEVNNITKSFKVYYDKGSELKEKMLFWKRNKYEMRQVLKGISFNVKKGEAIGLVGKNGCGKSTTLKMLTKIRLSVWCKNYAIVITRSTTIEFIVIFDFIIANQYFFWKINYNGILSRIKCIFFIMGFHTCNGHIP